jgi:uncharacterized protein YhaN
MKNRRFRTEISQMSSEKKTELILKAVDDNEKLEDELKILRRQIFKLDKKIKELADENQSLILEAATDIKKLEDENQRLNAQLEMNQDVTQPGDDYADAHTRTPSVATFTPRKYRKKTSTSTPTPMGIRKRYKTADWGTTGRTTGRPDTPQLPSNRVYKSQRTAQELRSTLFDESKPETLTPYNKEMKATTPPRKTTSRKGGKSKQTLRKRRKVFK